MATRRLHAWTASLEHRPIGRWRSFEDNHDISMHYIATLGLSAYDQLRKDTTCCRRVASAIGNSRLVQTRESALFRRGTNKTDAGRRAWQRWQRVRRETEA